MPLRRTALRVDVAAVVALCALGAAIRVSGLTSRDLWFDDAWAALPAHVPLSDAVHMLVTTPLYTLGLREWLVVGPGDTWWAQLPALVFGVAGIVAVYALVRAHGLPRLGAAIAAVVIAVGPTTVDYSTRVKEYPFDLLLSCLVLWLAERWRRAPGTRVLLGLGVAGIAAIWVSASTAAVVGGAAVLVVAVAWTRPEWRRGAVALVGAYAAGAVALYLVVLRHLPKELRANWRTKGFLFNYASVHHVAFAFQQVFAGLAHGMLGAPIAYTFDVYPLRDAVLALAAASFVLLVLLVGPPLATVLRTHGRVVGPLVASAGAMALAVLFVATELAPLGDGRTDEALYPPLLLLGVGAVTWLVQRVGARVTSRRWVHVAVASMVAAAAVAFGVTHRAAYPPTGLRQVYAQVLTQVRPSDVIVLDGYESFTYGDEQLGPWTVSFHQGTVPWPMGFHVASRAAKVVLSREYLQPDAQITTLQTRTHRIFFVGPTVGGYSTSAPSDLWPLFFPTPTRLAISKFPLFACPGFDRWINVRAPSQGTPQWLPTRVYCPSGAGTYAELFVWR